jgi:hypothetical protein
MASTSGRATFTNPNAARDKKASAAKNCDKNAQSAILYYQTL